MTLVLVGVRTFQLLVGTYTSPMYLPCSSMWTVKVIVDIPISNQRSLENVCKAFLRCFSARLKEFNQNRHSEYRFRQALTPSQLFLLQTTSSRPLWQQHCIVENIVDLCGPTLQPRVLSSVLLQLHLYESPT